MQIAPANGRTDPPAGLGTSGSGAASELGGDDFLQLLVTQLTHQDPLDPTSNQDLLKQLSSIRDIQLSSTLVDSLKNLTGNQRFGSAAALIGKTVTGRTGNEQTGFEDIGGTVIGVRFDPSGRVTLALDSGQTLPLDRVQSISGSDGSQSGLIGQHISGVDRSGDEPEIVEGIVTQVRRDEQGRLMLELDTGQQLAAADLVSAA